MLAVRWNSAMTLSSRQLCERLIAAYGTLVEEHLRAGWEGYFLSFMFHQLPGSPGAIKRQMAGYIELFYSTLLTKVIHKPRRKNMQPWLPVLISCPDLPRPKPHGKRQSLEDVSVNDGRHFHGILLIPPPPLSRLKSGVWQHVLLDERDRYFNRHTRVRHIDIRPITSTPEQVTDYGMKGIKTATAEPDDILILPKARSELTWPKVSREPSPSKPRRPFDPRSWASIPVTTRCAVIPARRKPTVE